MRSVDRGQL